MGHITVKVHVGSLSGLGLNDEVLFFVDYFMIYLYWSHGQETGKKMNFLNILNRAQRYYIKRENKVDLILNTDIAIGIGLNVLSSQRNIIHIYFT